MVMLRQFFVCIDVAYTDIDSDADVELVFVVVPLVVAFDTVFLGLVEHFYCIL
jgi:hypothetical protein